METIKRVSIKGFNGIALRVVTPGRGGVITYGPNGAGKTSEIEALRAALLGEGVDATAIHQGEDRAEILVDCDHFSVRRLITRSGTKVTVERADGTPENEAASFLKAIFGAAVDPCALLAAKPKDRVAIVQAAIPFSVTLEHLRKYAPDLPDATNCDGHGAVVIARVRQWYYDKRTAANAAEKSTRIEAERLEGEAAKTPRPEVIVALSVAEAERRTAEDALARLRTQDEEARKAIERTAATRQEIAALRTEAATLAASGTYDEERLIQAEASVQSARATIEDLERRLERARVELREREQAYRAVERERDLALDAQRRSASLVQQAKAMEDALCVAGPEPVSEDDIHAAECAVAETVQMVAHAQTMRAYTAAKSAAEAARAAHDLAKTEADRLDAIVKSLTDEAPRELALAAGGIPGLTFEGGDVAIDGVPMNRLCGAERVHLAVQVSKRSATRSGAKGRVLLVDGLERLDDEQRESMIESVRADGWQIWGTCVGGSELEHTVLDGAAVAS